MRDIPPAVKRIGSLCAKLEADADLRDLLDEEGLSADFWARIVEAVREGDVGSLIPLLTELEDVAAKAGLDGVTVGTREYRSLPISSPGVRTVSGWRCPHAQPCGRVEVGADPGIERRCELTGDPLSWASVTSR